MFILSETSCASITGLSVAQCTECGVLGHGMYVSGGTCTGNCQK